MKYYSWINAICFQIAWFCCVLGDTSMAIVATLVFLGFHLSITRQISEELQLVIPVAILGFCMDFFLDFMGLIDINPTGAFPVYMLCLWILFSCTLRWSMASILKFRYLAVGIGLLAPFSYLMGQKFEKLHYPEPLFYSIIIRHK